jgi:hypothetical protein
MMAMSLFSDSADDAGPRAELVDPARTVRFMLAGNAHVTFQSLKTSTRFTYRIRVAPNPERGGPTHFVFVLTGPDNQGGYDYLGCIFEERNYGHGRKSRIAESAPSAVAFRWVWYRLTAGEMHPELSVYHEGRCGRCGRRLTTPESIETGLGPVCAGKAQ